MMVMMETRDERREIESNGIVMEAVMDVAGA